MVIQSLAKVSPGRLSMKPLNSGGKAFCGPLFQTRVAAGSSASRWSIAWGSLKPNTWWMVLVCSTSVKLSRVSSSGAGTV